MTRLASVSLAEVWDSGDARSSLVACTVRLKLPISQTEYPQRHEMRQLSHGRSLPTGKCGPLDTWLAGRHIIFLQHNRDGELFWGVRYRTSLEAARAFADMAAFSDEQTEPQRGYPFKFDSREWVTVVDWEDDVVAKSLIDDGYCKHRRYAVKGQILSRVKLDREDFWLVDHGDGTIAAYFQYQLMPSDDKPMPKPTDFSVSRDCLRVRLASGEAVVLVKSSGGFSESHAIETFSIERDGNWVVRYQSPYQHPRNTDSRNGFVTLASGYDIKRAAEYWVTVDAYIRQLVKQAGGIPQLQEEHSELYRAFTILRSGDQDMSDVHRGRAQRAID